jgi:hypothetical protein
MQFIQYGMLGALAALAIPIIIHLLFRHRARLVDLGTLQFLKVVLRHDARRKKIRRLLLLAVRMACIAMIALLFARPYLVATEPTEGERLVVVLLDRSASMGLRGSSRPIDQALSEARSILDQSGSGTQLEIGLFDTVVQPMKQPTDLHKNAIEPTDAGTDYSAAMTWARDLFVKSRKQTMELHILTDLQRSGLDRGEPAILPPDVDVRLRDLGRSFPKNVAVTGIAIAPPAPRPGDATTVTATVLNASPLPLAKCPVRLEVEAGGQKRHLDRTVDLDGGATATVEFPLGELPEGLWRGHVEAATGDELPFDDRRFLAISVAPASRVLLLDGNPGRAPYEAATYFLQAALRLAPTGERYAKSPFDPRTVALVGGGGAFDLDKIEAVVLADVDDLGGSDAQRLAQFVENGCGLVIFTGDRLQAGSAQNLVAAGLGVGKVVGPAKAEGLPWRLDSWESQHAVFRPFADPEHGDLRRPVFDTITRIEPDPATRVLARFRGGEPALLERAKGRGKVLWFTSACDRSWSNWPRSRLYLPMVHQMLAYATGLSEGGPVRREIASHEKRAGIVDSGGLVHVINPDPLESDMARCKPEEFAARFGFRLPGPEPASTAAAGPSGADRSDDGRLRSDELWPWIAMSLIGLLLAESFLANRTAA